VSFSCWGSPFPKPPSRVICLHQADGQPSRGGASCAIKLARSASIPRRGRGNLRARLFAPIGPSSCNPRLRRLRRSVSGSGAAPNARIISLQSARHERAAMHRVPRLAAVFGSLHQARSTRPPSAVAVRSPPSEARASPRPRSHANQDVAFCVDQVLRSHRGSRDAERADVTAGQRRTADGAAQRFSPDYLPGMRIYYKA